MNVVLKAHDVAVTSGAEVLVNPVCLTLRKGQPFTILGETGSGKSLLAQALIGILPSKLTAAGQVEINGQKFDLHQGNKQRSQWGRKIAILPQEPWAALDPLMPALPQVAEGYALVQNLPWRRAKDQALTDLEALDLELAAGRRPHQLSGGMAQRVAFAAARAGGAQIIIADEPTKGLDAQRRDDIINLLNLEIAQGGTLLTITHDLEVARRLGGELAVMLKGEIIEQGAAEEILRNPRHDYTRRLIDADPQAWKQLSPRSPSKAPPIISATNLNISRGGKKLFSNLDIEIRAGEIVGVFGASGCGKTTLGDILLGLATPDCGHVTRIQSHNALHWQKLYQDPPSAFAGSTTLGKLLQDLIKKHHLDSSKIAPLMERMRLPEHLLQRRADEISGGELQRLSLLRLLLVEPIFLFADEPTSRLDLITQEEIIRLLVSLAREKNMALLLVSHDRFLLEKSSDRVLFLESKATKEDIMQWRFAS